MGSDTKALKRRIKSVDSTLHLTKAMGLVASSKMRRATEAMTNGREYSSAVGKIINALTLSPECRKSPYMKESNGKNIKLVVIAGDRGLAGGYNANVFRLAREYKSADIITIGKRACDRFGKELIFAERFSYKDAIDLAKTLCAEFVDGKYSRIGIIGTKYISMMTQEAHISWVLPLSKDCAEQESKSVLFEPDEMQVLNTAVPEYVAGTLIAAVRESFACEIAARRIAMDSAEKNAKKMIDDLQLEYNRARQSAITQEITEIVAGSGS